jgi:hypothetical protein
MKISAGKLGTPHLGKIVTFEDANGRERKGRLTRVDHQEAQPGEVVGPWLHIAPANLPVGRHNVTLPSPGFMGRVPTDNMCEVE